MKITQAELWLSLNRTYDKNHVRDMRDYGYVLPEALKACAVIMVRDGRNWDQPNYNPNQTMMDEQNIIDALKELRDDGFLTFKSNDDE